MRRLKEIIKNFKNKKILVIGDVYLDRYLITEAEKFSPEAPVPRAIVKEIEEVPGAAGNIANNFARLGAEVTIISVIGNDNDGKVLLRKLRERNINTDNIILDNERITGTFLRVLLNVNQKNRQHVIRVDYENKKKLSFEVKNQLINVLKEKIPQADCVFIADYDETHGTGIINSEIIGIINNLSKSNRKLSIGMSRLQINLFRDMNIIFLNKSEIENATGIRIDNDSNSLATATNSLRENLRNDMIIVTLGSEGLAAFSKDRLLKVPSFAEKVVDTCGAGDSLSAAFILSILSGANLEEACEIGNFSSSVSISQEGTNTVSAEELESAMFHYKSTLDGQSKILRKDTLDTIIINLKNKKKKVILANGFFDFIHGGHIKFLQEAKKLGDILIVAINSDESTCSNKGMNRPFINQEDRAKIISSFNFVDYVVIFEELTPIQIIKRIQPDILVKGGKTDIIVGKELVESLGGKTVLLPSYGISTEEFIESIRKGESIPSS